MIATRPIGGPALVANAARSWSSRRGLLVEIERDGRTGTGETSPLDEGELAIARAELASLPATIELESLDELEVSRGARFAVETALLDLRAQAERRSIAALLCGGAPGRVLASALVGDPRSPKGWDDRIKTIKLKVGPGRSWSAQAEAIDALCASHPAALLRLDFNGSLTLAEARSITRECEERGWPIDFIEDPVAAADLDALDTRIDVAIDAGLAARGGADLARSLASKGAAQVAVLKPALHGGLRRTHALATELAPSLDIVVSHLLDGPTALAAYVELACAIAASHLRAAGLGPHAALAAYQAPVASFDELPWLVSLASPLPRPR